MPRKKTETVGVHIRLPLKTHDALKVVAVSRGSSIPSLVRGCAGLALKRWALSGITKPEALEALNLPALETLAVDVGTLIRAGDIRRAVQALELYEQLQQS